MITSPPPPPEEHAPRDGWLTTQEVADLLHVSRRLVQHLIHQGELPASTVGQGGRLLRVARADLDTYMAQHKRSTSEERRVNG